MKTDIEKFKELFASVGIDLKEEVDKGMQGLVLPLNESVSAKLTSHEGNSGSINFDFNGKFLDMCFICKWQTRSDH